MSKKDRRERRRQRSKERQSEGSRGGKQYLQLPEGVELWAPDVGEHRDEVTKLEFLNYPVTVAGHPDGIKPDEGDDSLWDQRPYLLHRNIGPAGVDVVCPRSFAEWPTEGHVGRTQWLKAINARCPICDEHFRMADNDDNWDKQKNPDGYKLMQSLRPAVRELYCVIPLEKDDQPVCVFDYTWHWFGSALDKKINELPDDDDALDFAEYEGGSTVLVRWRATDLKQQRGKHEGEPFLETNPDAISFKSREDFDPDKIIDEVLALDEVLVRMSYDDIESLMQGLADESAVSSKAEADAEPTPSRRTRGGRRRGAENEDTVDEDAADEDEQPPKSSRRGRSRSESDDAKSSKKTEPEETPDDAALTEEDVPDGCKLCPACEGSRVNSRGRECRICNGKGYVKDVDEEENPAKDEEPPTRRGRRGRR